jgi:hypothetical protein
VAVAAVEAVDRLASRLLGWRVVLLPETWVQFHDFVTYFRKKIWPKMVFLTQNKVLNYAKI